MEIKLLPVATVHNSRIAATDDFWGSVITEITLVPGIPEAAFSNIEMFSHVDVIYYFDKADDKDVAYYGRPRGNAAYPEMGIYAQRKKDRPNHIGLCTAELLAHNGSTIIVRGLDAIEGTPVLDIKPVFKEFKAPADTKQPPWVADLMKDYWK